MAQSVLFESTFHQLIRMHQVILKYLYTSSVAISLCGWQQRVYAAARGIDQRPGMIAIRERKTVSMLWTPHIPKAVHYEGAANVTGTSLRRLRVSERALTGTLNSVSGGCEYHKKILPHGYWSELTHRRPPRAGRDGNIRPLYYLITWSGSRVVPPPQNRGGCSGKGVTSCATVFGIQLQVLTRSPISALISLIPLSMDASSQRGTGASLDFLEPKGGVGPSAVAGDGPAPGRTTQRKGRTAAPRARSRQPGAGPEAPLSDRPSRSGQACRASPPGCGCTAPRDRTPR